MHNFVYLHQNTDFSMITNSPSLDLVEFVETQILPRYANFDRAHNLEHVTRVIRRSLEMVKTTGADINMAYVIAAYHDLGMSGPRAVHHLIGGKILANDARLKKWFSSDRLWKIIVPRPAIRLGVSMVRLWQRQTETLAWIS